jgi:hypothetical protein
MHVRLAHPSEAPVIAAVLSAAAVNLVKRGEALWDITEVSESAVAPHAESGLYYIGFSRDLAVGVFRLQSIPLHTTPAPRRKMLICLSNHG